MQNPNITMQEETVERHWQGLGVTNKVMGVQTGTKGRHRTHRADEKTEQNRTGTQEAN